ncbi:MAG TPA: [protein-PII] uridylyltransferase [Marmoricola sp.]
MTAESRAQRAAEADALCARAFSDAAAPDAGVALVAVGGYGREELAPFSDLDVVLVLDDSVEPGEWAGQLWYPLWDSGQSIDHSVRSISQMLEQADADLRVMLGLLDLRHLAGDPNLTLRLRTSVLAAWRRDARRRLPELRELVGSRTRRQGELAHAAVPDIKESSGGLRDATVMRALVASWLVDVPHRELETARQGLLDVRDALQEVAGRATDRITPEYWPDIASSLGLEGAVGAQQHARALGRRMTHISRLTWRRAESARRRAAGATGPRRPDLRPVAPGVAISNDEVVLDKGARPQDDAVLLLRAAAVASERDLVLAPPTAARLARMSPALADPWPAEARDLLVRMLAGPGLLGVWETLDETGALARLLPEWDEVRLLPHASVVHRFTVDRHLVETCLAAAGLIRRVARPDVLMVAALLHDIGKGRTGDHSEAGEPIARRIAARLGFDDHETELIGRLVRSHLLLPETATTRDPDDPETVRLVVDRVRDHEELDLLAALTEADARATSEKAWTSWRAGLIEALVARSAAAMSDPAVAEPEPHSISVDPVEARLIGAGGSVIRVTSTRDGSIIHVLSADRTGLLAEAAAMLAVAGLSVRSARGWPQNVSVGREDIAAGASEWIVGETGLDAAVLRQRFEAITGGRIDIGARLAAPAHSRLEPSVVVRPEASQTATVLEVRADDRPGLIYTVAHALAGCDISVRSAHVATLGPQAVDVFYVHEAADGAGVLGPGRAEDAVRAVREALVVGEVREVR